MPRFFFYLPRFPADGDSSSENRADTAATDPVDGNFVLAQRAVDPDVCESSCPSPAKDQTDRCARYDPGQPFDIERYADSILVTSYRSDGIPSVSELERAMRRVKRRVRTVVYDRYQYALSTNRKSREVLLIGD